MRTDKEKIKEEIERQIEKGKVKCQESQENNDYESFVAWSEHVATCCKLLVFINSLPEEPKKQPKFKVGDTIKGPCNNIFKVKEVLDRQYVLHSENGDELNSIKIVDESSCLVEEHNEDLEEEIDRC